MTPHVNEPPPVRTIPCEEVRLPRLVAGRDTDDRTSA